MNYRDRLLACPRCTSPLERPARRETWTCSACNGLAIELDDLIRLLAKFSSGLVGRHANDVDAPTVSAAPLPCPVCTDPMRPVTLHGVRADRCDRDKLVWFDASELDRMIDEAIEDHEQQKGWLRRVRDLFFAN